MIKETRGGNKLPGGITSFPLVLSNGTVCEKVPIPRRKPVQVAIARALDVHIEAKLCTLNRQMAEEHLAMRCLIKEVVPTPEGGRFCFVVGLNAPPAGRGPRAAGNRLIQDGIPTPSNISHSLPPRNVHLLALLVTGRAH